MINAINDLIKCLSEGYFVIGVVLLCIILLSSGPARPQYSRNTVISFILVFSLLLIGRSFVYSTSSRYYAIFIILFFLLFVFSLKKDTLNSRLARYLLPCLLIVILYNSVKCFLAFRNNYVFDIKESIEKKIQKSHHTTVFIDTKEFKRLFLPTYDVLKQKELRRFPSSGEELDEILGQYDFWEDNAYFYSSNKALIGNEIRFSLDEQYFDLKKVENYNLYNNKKFTVYSLNKFRPPVFYCSELRQDPFLNNVLENGIMKSCNPQYNTFIFQFNHQLVWFIGTQITKQTEIILHFQTSRPDLLPPKRIQFKFDNLGFRMGDSCEIGIFGPYRVFAKGIPTEYPITKVVVGLNAPDNHVFFNSFQISKDH